MKRVLMKKVGRYIVKDLEHMKIRKRYGKLVLEMIKH